MNVESVLRSLATNKYVAWMVLAVASVVLGMWVADGEWKYMVLIVGVIGFATLTLRRDLFLAVAMVCAIAAEIVLVSGNLIGVPQLRIPRVLAILAFIHVARTLYENGIKTGWVRWTAMDTAVSLYFAISSFGAIGMGEEATYLWESVIVGPVALYFAVRSMNLDERDYSAVAQAVFWGGTLLALSILFDFATGTANFVPASRGYAWTESQSNVFRPGGLIGQPVRAATLCALAVAWAPVILSRAKRFKALYVAGMFVQLIAVAVTFTRAAWMGAGIVILIYAGARYGLKSQVFLASVAAGAAAWLVSSFENTVRFTRAVLRPDTIAYRFSLWSFAVSPLNSGSPKDLLIGAGLYATRHPEFASAYTLVLSGTHNAYLTSLLEHGIFGLAAYVGVVLGPMVLGVRGLRTGEPQIRSASLCLIGLSVIVSIASVSSELVRQYNVPATFLLSAGVLSSMLLHKAAPEGD